MHLGVLWCGRIVHEMCLLQHGLACTYRLRCLRNITRNAERLMPRIELNSHCRLRVWMCLGVCVYMSLICQCAAESAEAVVTTQMNNIRWNGGRCTINIYSYAGLSVSCDVHCGHTTHEYIYFKMFQPSTQAFSDFR